MTKRLLQHTTREELTDGYLFTIERAHISVAELAEWVATSRDAVQRSISTSSFQRSAHSSAFAGRAFAAYGGIYVVSSLAWMAVVEHMTPRVTDYVGAAVCVAGAGIILYGSRWSLG